MSFKGVLEIDNKKFTILNWNIRINQRVDETGRPTANPTGGYITLTLESTDSNDFLDWAVSADMTKNGSVIFQRRENDTSLRKFEFKDAFCIDYVEDFNANGSNPLSIRLVLSAQSLKSGMTELAKNWNKI